MCNVNTPLLPQAFITANKLSRHLSSEMHQEENSEGGGGGGLLYACHVEECRGKSVRFATAAYLNNHLKRHARPLDFACTSLGCDAKYQTQKELKTHLRTANHQDLEAQHSCHQVDSLNKYCCLPHGRSKFTSFSFFFGSFTFSCFVEQP